MIKKIETQTRSDRYCFHESQLTQDIHPMLTQCWSTVCDAMLAYILNQNKVRLNSCLYMFVVLMLVQCRRRWLNFEKTFDQNENRTNRKVCFENDGCDKYSRPLRQRLTLYSNNESHLL